jgi:hypothetical protein
MGNSGSEYLFGSACVDAAGTGVSSDIEKCFATRRVDCRRKLLSNPLTEPRNDELLEHQTTMRELIIRTRKNQWMNVPVARATQTTVTKLVKNIRTVYAMVFEYAIAKATWTMYSGTNTVSIQCIKVSPMAGAPGRRKFVIENQKRLSMRLRRLSLSPAETRPKSWAEWMTGRNFHRKNPVAYLRLK